MSLVFVFSTIRMTSLILSVFRSRSTKIFPLATFNASSSDGILSEVSLSLSTMVNCCNSSHVYSSGSPFPLVVRSIVRSCIRNGTPSFETFTSISTISTPRRIASMIAPTEFSGCLSCAPR